MRDVLNNLIEMVEAGMWDGSWRQLMDKDLGIEPLQFSDAYHGSLNAAHQLHKTLLPGWRFKIEQHEIVAHGDDFTACVWPNDYSRREQVFRQSGEAPTAARAWLLGILNALEAQRAHDAGRRA